MKSMFHMMRRFKLASTLNLLGLTAAFAVAYIMLTQIIFQYTYNKGVDGWENLYRLEATNVGSDQWSSMISRPTVNGQESTPGIQSVGMFAERGTYRLDKGGTVIETDQCCMTTHTLTTIGARLLDGTLTPSGDREGVIIPASLAEKYFGSVAVAGRTMKERDGGREVTVIGVFEDFPSNCNFPNSVYYDMKDENIDQLGMWSYECYVRVQPEANVDNIVNILVKKLRETYRIWFLKGTKITPRIQKEIDSQKLRMVPVDETYFSGVNPWHDRGSRTTMLLLQLASVLVIVIAAINFSNFTLAETPMRIKSINTRRVLGSSLARLRLSLIGEGVVQSLVALVLAFIVVSVLVIMPDVKSMLHGQVGLSDNILLAFFLFLVALLVGILTSLYPAFYATSFAPALALKGSFGLSARGRVLRMVLVALQLMVSFGMMIFLCVLLCQNSYLHTSDYGFDKDQILTGAIYQKVPVEKAEVLRQEILRLPGVEAAAYSQSGLGSTDGGNTWTRADENVSFTFRVFPVGDDFLKTYGIRIVEGRDFTRHDQSVYIINEAMKRQYPTIEMDKPLFDGDAYTVIGVCNDLRFGTTHLDNSNIACAFVYNTGSIKDDYLYLLSVRISAGCNQFECRKAIEGVLAHYTTDVPEMKFLDDKIEEVYLEEYRFIKQIYCFAIICFLITLVGVFCLTMFESEYRRKEVAIRKIMGSSISAVLRLFVGRYIVPLVASFAIAAPIGYYLCVLWLQNFAEHTPIFWWIFPLSFVVVSVVVVLTIIIQSWRVATTNPIESLKSE